MNKNSSSYRRMYETQNVRPYYTVAHLGIIGHIFKEWLGFEYKKTIYIVSKEMNNSAYFNIAEMEETTEFFRKLWHDDEKIKHLLNDVKNSLAEAVILENYGWKQDWASKDTKSLILEMNKYFDFLLKVFSKMFISQPQHVLPLDQEISALIEKYPNDHELLVASTFYEGDLPWAEENRELEFLHKDWETLSKEEKDKYLENLVKKYGWFNEIEGDKPFDNGHYLKKILNFTAEENRKSIISVPPDIYKIGHLIGELGFLRFWTRYHFMSIRYHLKKILAELVKRAGNPDLEFAIVEEMNNFFADKKPDLEEIKRRRNGYGAQLVNGYAEIVTGEKLENLKNLVKEDVTNVNEVRGRTANRGKAKGKVRIISFVAKNYNEEVAAFKKGEILVTGMTRPQIVHLCRLAAAIITDEGGITSHAAVVGREFDIPCIIATHNGTKILKTGDMVEVDADRGIVRKISDKNAK